MAKNYCGLDFGTSNSTVGVLNNSQPQLLPLEGDNKTIPSTIFFNSETATVHFGREAISEYIDGEFGRFMRSLKSVLGTPLMHEKTTVKNQRISLIDVIGKFMEELKKRSENHLGTKLDSVVLGRPVHFIDHERNQDNDAQKALHDAARKIGFKNIDFQYEPIAAALDYEQQINKEETALIVDIGGGTSDFSIVRISPERRNAADRKEDILANEGVHVGGTDFDKWLSLQNVMPLLGYGASYRDNPNLTTPANYYHDLATWHMIHFLYAQQTILAVKDLRSRIKESFL